MGSKVSSLNAPYDVFIFAGEASGDAIGAHLIQSLLQLNPSLKIGAVAGPLMRKHPIHTLYVMEEFQVMGFVDVIKNLPKLLKLFHQIKAHLLKASPQAIVLIDYPGFNLRLARHLRKCGYTKKLIQYVAPSVWAWKKGRIKTLSKTLDLLISIFPFEKKHFANTSLHVEYIGHPLLAISHPTILKKPLPRLTHPLLTIFPGSRVHEIKSNLPLQLQAAIALNKGRYQLAISYASISLLPFIQKEIDNYQDENILLFSGEHNAYYMQQTELAIATSGTITLELALHQVPTLVTYSMKSFDCFLAKHVFRIKLPHYCIVNYIAEARVFPEFYGPCFNQEMLYQTLSFMLDTPEELELCRQTCLLIPKFLCHNDPNLAAATLVLAFL